MPTKSKNYPLRPKQKEMITKRQKSRKAAHEEEENARLIDFEKPTIEVATVWELMIHRIVQKQKEIKFDIFILSYI